MLETKRLILRQWQDSDREPFAQLNADAEVMRYFPKPLTRSESDAMVDKINCLFAENGWGLWAVSLKRTNAFIGFVGLHRHTDEAIPQTPFVEIGWRLAKAYWGKGYAFEAAQASMDYAFNILKLETLYSFTATINEPSWRLMEKLGMHNTHQDFNHPKVDKGHALEKHYLYQIERNKFSLK